MSKHTYGPWKFVVADLAPSEHEITYHEIYGNNNSVIARRIINSDDARLMSAAPEMYEALKALQASAQAQRDAGVLPRHWEFILNETMPALAKAEGRDNE